MTMMRRMMRRMMRTRLSTITDTIQKYRKEAFPQVAAIKRTVTFKPITELDEPDPDTVDRDQTPPKETILREEDTTQPTCPYNPIQLTQTPIQGSHKKGLAFQDKTEERIFDGLAARAEIGYRSRSDLCQQNPLQKLNEKLTRDPKLREDILPLSYIER